MPRPDNQNADPVGACLDALAALHSTPLDFLTGVNLCEKLVGLSLAGVPAGPSRITGGLAALAQAIREAGTDSVNMVVFGGGTGLSNIIGGDSRSPGWPKAPFQGIKELFPNTASIVCVTDDGGSTGELLRDMPVIALGDLRHVLLSSVQLRRLREKYGLGADEASKFAGVVHQLFNYRFSRRPTSPSKLVKNATGKGFTLLPKTVQEIFSELIDFLFTDKTLAKQLDRSHCLGNLLLAAAIFRQGGELAGRNSSLGPDTYIAALGYLAEALGAGPGSVLPCTTTPAGLKVLYANGVLVTGEYKSAFARRGYAMDRVFVEFVAEPEVPAEVISTIRRADILLFAPGSLYTSIIPILQVPGIAEAIRDNRQALKVLITNLWIQKGETDLVREAPGRRFYISDLIRAYHRNIPGGISGLFRHIMVMKFQDIPGSILQNYAIEDKVPIYFDREKVESIGITPIEANIFSQNALTERRVVQHDPQSVSKAVKTLWAARSQLHAGGGELVLPPCKTFSATINPAGETPDRRLRKVVKRLEELGVAAGIRDQLVDILWEHRDIPLAHLDFINGVEIVKSSAWRRSQVWDKIYSFYDPYDGLIKLHHDVMTEKRRLEQAFLVALGQSILGNYFADKQMVPIEKDGVPLGKVFEISLRPENERRCYLRGPELDHYLRLSRMNRASDDALRYTRLVNGSEGFTPPGLLMGLTYAWYLDNRLAAHVEYKMAIMRTPVSGLIPEQMKVFSRRRAIIDFFRTVVFRYE